MDKHILYEVYLFSCEENGIPKEFCIRIFDEDTIEDMEKLVLDLLAIDLPLKINPYIYWTESEVK